MASTVALRHGLHRNQLYMWRREVRSGTLANADTLPDFVPIVAESRAVSRTAAIEIEIGGAVLRADAGVDLAFLGKIIRLLKKLYACISDAALRRNCQGWLQVAQGCLVRESVSLRWRTRNVRSAGRLVCPGCH